MPKPGSKMRKSSIDYAGKLDSIIKCKQREDADFPGVAVGYSIFEAGKNARDTIDLADHNMYKDKRTKENRNLRWDRPL